MITFKYYNRDFLVENKLNDSNSLILLDTIFGWIFNSKHPQYKIINDKICFYISQKYLASLLDSVMNFVTINRKFSNFKNCGLITKEYESMDRKAFYSFNWEIVRKCLATEDELKEIGFDNNWLNIISDYENKNINSYNHIKDGNKMLFDPEERKGYSIQAECLVKKLVKKNRNLFTTKLPEDYADGRKTKTYIKACKTVQDIYNGNFNSRYYPLSEKFLKNKEFDFSDYKNKLQEVKGDWNKVKKLLIMAVENYKLMFEQDRMPTHKKSLTTNIQAWLYDGWNGGTKEPTAYFIYCLNEPKPTLEQFSNMKADKIYEKLPESVKDYGNNSIQLYFTGSAYPGIVWEHIRQIYEWGNTLLNYDDNAKYWISKDGNIIQKFNEYLKERNISVSINTFDIEKSTKCNGPWCWFISEAIKEHSLNSSLVSCVTDDDFYDCYNSNSSSYKDEDVYIEF